MGLCKYELFVVDDHRRLIHRCKKEKFSGKLKLTSSRGQQKAWKEIEARRTVKHPLQLQIEMDRAGRIYKEEQVLQQNRDSIRKILESRIIYSSIPSRYEQSDQNSLSISDQTILVSHDKTDIKNKWASVSYRNGFHYADLSVPKEHPSLNITMQSYEGVVNCNLDESQDIDDYIIECFYEQKDKKTLEMSLQPKIITSRDRQGSCESDSWSPVSHLDNDKALSIAISRPPSTVSTKNLPETEDCTSQAGFNINKSGKKDKRQNNQMMPNSPRPSSSVALAKGHGQGRVQSGRPTWPSLIDIQRLRSGGFRYRPSTVKTKGASTAASRPQSGIKITDLDKTGSTIVRTGTIIVPSHTTVDCPLCNLYASEHTNSQDRNLTVYQHPCHVKVMESTKKQKKFGSKKIKQSHKSGVSSLSTGSHSRGTINTATTKQSNINKYHDEKAFPHRRANSASIITVNKIPYPFNQSVQIPLVATYDQTEHSRYHTPHLYSTWKFSYVKAPAKVTDNE